ncbi:hypothetical protein V1508DRAFT_457095 [Lipomyces doorenjongii]|uniref:uncharacterized protein n=1 Tax=Lipomyces doorenjongii TaxID=383834 RepID=UPI0034CE8400
MLAQKFLEQPIGSGPAAPYVPNQLLDLVDSSPDSQQPKQVRLLSSSAQEQSRPLFPISPSTDSDDVLLIILDRLQEALDSTLFKPPAQDDKLMVSNDAQAVSDGFCTTSPSSQPDPRQEAAFHTQSFLQWESSSTRPPLFGPEAGIEVSSTNLSEVLWSTPIRPCTEWENSQLAVAQPIDEQVTPEFQTDIVQTPSSPVGCTAANEVNAKPNQLDSGKEIAAAKMRMADIFNRAKETFGPVKTVTPIGAVTSSIKTNEITEIVRISLFLLPIHVHCQPAPQLGQLSRERVNLGTWFEVQ